MSRMQEMLPRVRAYLAGRNWDAVPVMRGRRFQVHPLAQGEYNLNYRLADDRGQLVLRVNIGTQINRPDQIVYEYKALRVLAESGVTPAAYFVDDTRAEMDHGILIMEYLPGGPLDYRKDSPDAAALFAAIHQVPVPASRNHLIRETAPLTLIFQECDALLTRYIRSELADPEIRGYLIDLRAWADGARRKESAFQSDPWPCVVNTEVNSGNFIANREKGTLHLVDWEMPRWGDPSSDLCHFCSPLTTLWKTDFRMTPDQKAGFLEHYKTRIRDRHLRDTLMDRIALKDPFVYLRGISWSAMGWVAYQTEFSGMRNPDTWRTLERYMKIEFIRSLFDPFMESGG